MAVVVMRPPGRGPGGAGRRGRGAGCAADPRDAAGLARGRGSGVVGAEVGAAALGAHVGGRRGASRATSSRLSVSGSSPGAIAASAADASRPGRRRRAPRPRRSHIAACSARRAPGAAAAGRGGRRARRRADGPLGPVVRVAGERLGRAGGQHRRLQQAVRGEPVGAVGAGGRALADREEARAASCARPCRPGRRRWRSARPGVTGIGSRARSRPCSAQIAATVGKRRWTRRGRGGACRA